jgi:anti-sigma factor RsiW
MKLRKLNDDTLMDYVDGRLDDEDQRQIERVLEMDPAVGARVATLAEARRHGREPPSASLGQKQLEARVRAFAASGKNVPKRPRREWQLTIVAIIAASLVVAVWIAVTGEWPLQ